PQKARRRWGTIINISSVGGLVAYCGGGIYHGCKFALEGMTESLVEELRPLGIKVILAEPGAFRTDIFTRSCKFSEPIADYSITPVAPMRENVGLKTDSLPDPAIVARCLLDAEARDDLPLRWRGGENFSGPAD